MELEKFPVLTGFSKEALTMLRQSAMHTRQYEKGAFVFHAGDETHHIGLVTSGCVHIENNDLWGNRSILGSVEAGGAFGETYALCRTAMMVDVVCAARSEIVLLDVDAALAADSPVRAQLLENLLRLSMQKNLALSERIFCTAARSIRGRLLTYLSAQSVRAGAKTFRIPFDRQQLADYLNVERTALSKELGKMRTDGLLEWHKNVFTLKAEGTGAAAAR